jgi:hypothetical protein
MIHPQNLWQVTTIWCIHKTRQMITVWFIHKTVRRSRYDPSTNPATGDHSMMHTQNQPDDHGMIYPQKRPTYKVWSIHKSCDRGPQYDAYTKPARRSRYDPTTKTSNVHGMIHPQILWQVNTVWCIHKTRQMTTAAWSSIKPVSDDQSRLHPQNLCQRPHRIFQSLKSESDLPETQFNHDYENSSVDTTYGLDGQGIVLWLFPVGPKDVFFLSKTSRPAAVSVQLHFKEKQL